MNLFHRSTISPVAQAEQSVVKAKDKLARLKEQEATAGEELVELKVQAQHAAEGFGTGLDDLSHEIAAAEAKVGALASAMNMGAGPSLAPVRSAPIPPSLSAKRSCC